MSELLPGSAFGGSGGSAVGTGGGVLGAGETITGADAGPVVEGSPFGGSGGSATETGGGVLGVDHGGESADSLGAWRTFTRTLAHRGPHYLTASARYRSAVSQRLQRFPVIG